MKTISIISILALMTLISCGKNGGGSNSSQQEQLEPVTDGVYHAVLRPFNTQASGYLPTGTATFTVKGDNFQAKTLLDDDARVTHRQSVHFGTRCPNNEQDDKNGDGYVDYAEAMAVVGKVIIPLDNDLSSQAGGANVYPKGTGFTYTRSTSISRLNADLWMADEDGSDDIAKLGSGENVGINNRVVLIHGAAVKSTFPVSLAARAGEAANLSLPIACGVVRKVN